MSETFEQRALRSLRQRHVDGARKAAEHLREYAAYVIRDLDAGRVPSEHLVSDALELERRITALDAVTDTAGIFESALSQASTR